MELENYTGNSFVVKAIQITEENKSEVSEAMGDTIRIDSSKYGAREYINIKIKIMNREQTLRAYIGDWVTFRSDPSPFMVYGDRMFKKRFAR